MIEMLHLVPPAGFPISLPDIGRIVMAAIRPSSGEDEFSGQIKSFTGAGHCFLFNLARTGLYFTLKAMASFADKSKQEVVLPAYTCFTVAAPVARAGLKIRLVDIDPLTMDFDYTQLKRLDFDRILAIIPSSLFGIIADWDSLEKIRQEHQVFLIDDAAQAFGSYHHGRAAGSFGDVGLYSLDRGKPLSTYLGGVLITDNDNLALKIKDLVGQMNEPGLMTSLGMLAKIIMYSLFLRPWLYWLPNSLPFLKLGQTIFDENFRIDRLSKLQSCSGLILLPKLEEVIKKRRQNGVRLCRALLASGKFQIPGSDREPLPVYLRLPLLARNKHERDLLISGLRARGIAAGLMYPATIRQIRGIEKYMATEAADFPGAQQVVDRLVTLPTHPYVGDKDIARIIDVCASIGA
jgi:perosamine synthetase